MTVDEMVDMCAHCRLTKKLVVLERFCSWACAWAFNMGFN